MNFHQGVLPGIGVIGLLEALAAGLHVVQIFVDMQAVVGHLDAAPGDVGAVVGHALQTGEQVGPDEAQLDGTLDLLQPQDVAVAQLLLQSVHHLLQRLDLCGQDRVVQ